MKICSVSNASGSTVTCDLIRPVSFARFEYNHERHLPTYPSEGRRRPARFSRPGGVTDLAGYWAPGLDTNSFLVFSLHEIIDCSPAVRR